MEQTKVVLPRQEATEEIVNLVNTGLEEYKAQVDDYFSDLNEDPSKTEDMDTFVCSSPRCFLFILFT